MEVAWLEKVQADQNREWLLLARWTQGDRPSAARVLVSLKQPFQASVIWYHYRVILCTLLATRNKYTYSRVAGDRPLMRAVAIRCAVWKTQHRCHLFMKLCSHILQKYAFLSFALYWSALPEPFSSLIKDAESLLFYLRFQELIYTDCLGICFLGRIYYYMNENAFLKLLISSRF